MKNWIKSGAEVAHRDNIIQKMFVEDIVKRSAANGNMTLVVGVKCHWWQETTGKKSVYQFGVFHTRELVPWDVAMRGPQEVQKFIETTYYDDKQ